jgi:hypothetical protein
LTDQIMAEINREDQPRDLEWCLASWQEAMQGANQLHSASRFQDAVSVYTAMRAAWPSEIRVKALREQIVHW